MDILLVSNQLEGYANCRLAKLLQADGHDTRVIEAHWYHFAENDSLRDYYDEHDFKSFRTFQSEYESLYSDDWDVDWEYLEWFESERCVTKGIHELLLTDPTLQHHHHPRRPYFTPIESRELLYHWTESLLKWTEGQIESFDPDLIVMIGINQFVKNATAQIANSTDRDLLSLITSRIGDYVHFTPNYGFGQDVRSDEYIHDESLTDYDLSEANEYIESFRETGGGLYELPTMEWVDGNIVNPVDELKTVVSQHFRHLKRDLTGQKRNYRGGVLTQNHFMASTSRLLKFHRRVAANRLRYHYGNSSGEWFATTLPDRPFVYYPLHFRPESASLALTNEYYAADLIRYLSKELPIGLEMAVKEHPKMVGPRERSFYEEISQLPNVHLIDPTVPSKDIIRASRGVLGICGTALLEAALLGKTTLALGLPEFLDVLDYHGRDAVADFAQQSLEASGEMRNERAHRYVQYVFDNGRELAFDPLRYRYPDPDAFEDAVDTVYEMLTDEISRTVTSTAD